MADSIYVEIVEEEITLDVNAINVIATGWSGGKLEKTVLHSDLTDLSQSVGAIPANAIILKIVVDVTEIFECGMTIGTVVSEGLLTTLADVNIAKIGTYTIENFYKFSTGDSLFAFFSASSLTGNLKIMIFYL